MRGIFILSLCVACLCTLPLVKGQNISTVAGIGSASFSGDGAAAIAAELANPVSVAKDGAGNVYISDQGNHRIRKIAAATGYITTVAGTSTSGYSGDEGLATAAKLYYPAGIAVDGSGNIYFADKGNQRIRKITAATGIITTIAGTGTAGFSGDGGSATAAKLDNPSAVAIDASGNIYISDQYNQRIRKITATTGNITTVAGNGTYGYTGDGAAATSAELANPAGLRVDASGNIYVADAFNHAVRKITASTGYISTIAGTGASGFSGDGAAATAAKLEYPSDVALDDSGNVYIAAQYSHRIRKISLSSGYINTIAGNGTAGYSGDGGPALLAALYYPTGITIDASGNLYIADRENHRIRFICNWTVLPVVSGPVSYCQGQPATALSATGTSLKWWTTRIGGTGTTTAPTPATGTVGTVTYYVSTTSPEGCDGPRDSIKVTVNPLPAAPAATTSISYCVGAAATALTATGTGLKWYTLASGGTGSTSAPVPVTATAGVTTYYVSQSIAATGCESPRVAITVTVTGAPAAPAAASPVNYCVGSSATALSATGTGLLWYTAASGGTGSATAPVPVTTIAGSTIYYVSQTSTLGCGESPRTAITVNVSGFPAPPTVVSPVTYCSGAAAAALSATGTGLRWYTSATGGSGTATAPVPATSTAGTTKYYVSQTNATGCESQRDSITVIVNALPDPPVVSSPVTYCTGAAASALTAGGTGLKWYNVSSGGTAMPSAPVPSTAVAGTTTYYVTGTNATGCESPRAAIAVVVVDGGIPPSATGTVNYCAGDAAAALTASGTALKWYTVATGGTGSTSAPIPSTTTAGTTIYYVSQTTSCGESSRTAITVTVKPVPAAPSVVSPVIYCQGDVTTALTAGGTNLKWYATLTGGGSVGTTAVPSSAFPGSYVYYVSQTNSDGCESSRSTINLKINPAPAAPVVTTPVNYCVGAAATPLTAIGTGLHWYTTATGGTGSTTAPTPVTTVAGTTTYYVSQASDTSGCEGLRAAIVVIVNPVLSAPAVTSPVNYCIGAPTTALSASGTLLKWYPGATGGTGVTTAPVPSSATAGSTSYFVSQTSAAGCGESPRSEIVVNINTRPGAPSVTTPVNYCAGAAASPLTATGATLQWYSTTTGGTAGTTAPVPSTATPGVKKYYVSQVNAAGCEGPRDSITVNVTALPAAPVVSTPVNYCLGASATALTASGTGLLWYTVASGGAGSTTAPVPVTSATGTVIYYVSQTTGCESSRAAITVNVNTAAVAPAVTSPVNYCVGATATALTAGGTSLKWYTAATGGTAATTIVPSTATAGTTTYYVSQTAATGCGESARSAIDVVVHTRPGAPVVSVDSYSYCAGAPATVLAATGVSLKWYTVSSGGTGVTAAPVPATTAAGLTSYYVSQTDTAGCESSRARIKVNVNAIPAAPVVASPAELCADAPEIPLTATGINLKWYTVASGGTASTTAPTPPTSSTGASNYYVSQTSALGCEGPRAAINVIVYATPPAPTVGFVVNVCVGGTPMPLTATGSNLKWYAAATGGTGSITPPSPPTTTPGSTLYYVSQTSSSGCEGPRAAIRVNVDTLLAPPVVVTPVVYCQNAASVALTATGRSLLWYTTKAGTGSASAPVPSTTVPGNFKYYVTQTASTGCESKKDSITVRINALPAPPAVVSPAGACIDATPVPLKATGISLKWYTTATGGTGTATAPVPPTSAVGMTTYYVSSTSTEGCEGPRAAIDYYITLVPSVTITPIGMPVFVYCKDDSLQLQANSALAVSYQWYRNTVLLPGATDMRYKAFNAADYAVVIKNFIGCEGTASVKVIADTLPVPTLSPTSLNFCPNVNVVLFAKPVIAGYTYQWFKDDITIAAATASSLVINKSGIYKIKVTNIYGCATMTNESVANAYPAPKKPVIIRLDPVLRIAGSYRTYQWYRNGKPISGASTNSYTMPFGGRYHVEVTDGNDCMTQSDTVDTDKVGIDPVQAVKNSIRLYPNPTSGKILIDAAVPVMIRVTDLTGRLILERKYSGEADLSAYADGLYVFTVTDEEGHILLVEKVNKLSQGQ